MKKTKKSKLILIPTPIDEENGLDSRSFDILKKASSSELRNSSVFAIEDLKPGRRRWIRWGLPREVVDSFVLYNEHTKKEASHSLLQSLKDGKNVYLMSDAGLPAFCDPGQLLVNLCHENKIKVTSAPFENSIALAIALSGFDSSEFLFAGFLPREESSRAAKLKSLSTNKEMIVLMDTPYRLKKLLSECRLTFGSNRRAFLALELNSSAEEMLRGSVSSIIDRYHGEKRQFILVLEKK